MMLMTWSSQTCCQIQRNAACAASVANPWFHLDLRITQPSSSPGPPSGFHTPMRPTISAPALSTPHHGLRIACLWAAKDEPRSQNNRRAMINKRVTQFHAFSPRHCPALASISVPSSPPILPVKNLATLVSQLRPWFKAKGNRNCRLAV